MPRQTIGPEAQALQPVLPGPDDVDRKLAKNPGLDYHSSYKPVLPVYLSPQHAAFKRMQQLVQQARSQGNQPKPASLPNPESQQTVFELWQRVAQLSSARK